MLCAASRWHTVGLREDGAPSFKLEHLSIANDIHHADAHDAMSDVYATIGIAKLIKEKQPKLYQFVFGKRTKHAVNELIDCFNRTPLVHISSKIVCYAGMCNLDCSNLPTPNQQK